MDDDIKKFLALSSLSASTRELYGYHLIELARWMDNQTIEAERLTAYALMEYLDSRGWGSSSRNLAACAARKFWAWRFGQQHEVCQVRVRRDDCGPQRTLSKREIEQLVAAIDTNEPKGIRDLALIMLLLDTGLRASEICSLTLDKLDTGERLAWVKTKGGKWQPAAYFEYAASCLENWLSLRPRIAKKGTREVFVSLGGRQPGRKLTRDGLRAIIARLGESAELGERISPHALRRSFATLATRQGAPSRTVQLGGRWSNIAMVERYSRALEIKAMAPYSPANFVMGLSNRFGEDR